MAEDLYKNADPGHCVLCGLPNRNNLCRTHYRQYRTPHGTLPRWLIELQNEQRRRGDRGTHRVEVASGLTPVKQ